MVSGSTKKPDTTSCSVMLVSVVPSHNIAMKFIHKSFLCIFLKKEFRHGFDEIPTTALIFIRTRLKFDSMNLFQLNVVLEVSKLLSFYSNVMRNVEEFFQRCLFSFSHSFKTSTNCRIGWCFLNNLMRCDSKTSYNSSLIFLLSYCNCLSISSCIIRQ